MKFLLNNFQITFVVFIQACLCIFGVWVFDVIFVEKGLNKNVLDMFVPVGEFLTIVILISLPFDLWLKIKQWRKKMEKK